MEFVERLNKLLLEHEVTAYTLAKDADFSESLVTKWKKDPNTRPSTEVAIKIADYFNISLDWLLRGISEENKGVNSTLNDLEQHEAQLLEYFRRLPDDEKYMTIGNIQGKVEVYSALANHSTALKEEYAEESYIYMKVFANPAAAGIGGYFSDHLDYEEIRVKTSEVHPRADFGIRIDGDSMQPDILDKSIVWVKEQRQIENGQVGIFMLEEEAYCKKLKIDYNNKGERTVQLVSTNPKYKPIKIDEHSGLVTVGLVLPKLKTH